MVLLTASLLVFWQAVVVKHSKTGAMTSFSHGVLRTKPSRRYIWNLVIHPRWGFCGNS